MTAEHVANSSPKEFLPQLDIHAPERQRRWTVFLRLLLLIPHNFVLFFAGIAAFVVLFLGWWGALFLGRLPHWAAEFLTSYLRYATRINAYSYLLVDTYPPFHWDASDYPVSIRVEPGQLNRWAVFFRFILLIPVNILTGILAAGWAILGFFIWVTVLIIGRTPQPVFGASAALLRFSYRYQAYAMMLTSAYPKRLFGDTDHSGAAADRLGSAISAEPTEEPAHASDTRPLILTKGGTAFLVAFLALGILGYAGGGVTAGMTGPGSGTNHHQIIEDR